MLLQAACTHYKPPLTAPPMDGARIVGKIVEGALPAFEPKEDPKKSYFIVTPGYVLYYNFLQWENAEQKMTIEGLRAELKKKK
jgi:hypothetical protein